MCGCGGVGVMFVSSILFRVREERGEKREMAECNSMRVLELVDPLRGVILKERRKRPIAAVLTASSEDEDEDEDEEDTDTNTNTDTNTDKDEEEDVSMKEKEKEKETHRVNPLALSPPRMMYCSQSQPMGLNLNLNSSATDEASRVRTTLGTQWTVEKAKTITDWMYMGAYQMKILDVAISEGRAFIRSNAILGIVLSTLSGTLSITTFTVGGSSSGSSIYSIFASSLFTLFSFTVAIYTGYIKIYHVQERLEENIKNRQDWVGFTSVITTELQLPLNLRRDALYLIVKFKDMYVGLIKRESDIPHRLRRRVDAEMVTRQTAETDTDHPEIQTFTTLADFVYTVQKGLMGAVRKAEEAKHDLESGQEFDIVRRVSLVSHL